MKKLNITKEQFNRSNYFKNKYGKLEYVSESGRLFKTNKGKILMFRESFGTGFGDRFCDCESDPIEYNGQTYDTWTMYSGDDEVGDVMFADDALRQAMDKEGVDPEIMEMVDLWVNPRDSVEDAIDQIISG